ncbi:androgen-induced gene 1 protein-like isoform X2 [Leptotrombidium deliense]|uniref:Androgen-induced gene 1 protein-like isoform X2 n=1 Tax=Leptotrombidium deliense TaxID=299467 RepID=A0A443S2V5_9ACAR|nr:androgen-induced gene 1 protein-like isoform X2 [Leptotrombidium deliense]
MWDVNPHLKASVGEGKLRFLCILTVWNLYIHFFFFGWCLLNDLRVFKNERFEKRREDLVYHSLVVPLGLFVGIAFWSIYLYDPDMMIPENVRQYFPAWYNHCLHTLIIPGSLIEGFCYFHQLPKRRSGISLLSKVLFSYGAIILYFGYFQQFWIYPLLRVLPFPLKLLFIAFCCCLVIFHYFVGEILNKLWWKNNIYEQ